MYIHSDYRSMQAIRWLDSCNYMKSLLTELQSRSFFFFFKCRHLKLRSCAYGKVKIVVEFRGWHAFLLISSHSANVKTKLFSFVYVIYHQWILLVLLNLLFCCSDLREPAPNNRSFDKATEDSVKKLCFVIVLVVSEPNWLGAEGFLWDE